MLVVGSGPAGLAAALAAARAGVDVTLVERFGCFGGNITAVGVEGMAWYRHEDTIEANGIGREFETRAHEMGAAVPESQSLSFELDAEGFKVVADTLVEEAGIRGMLHRTFVAPIMDGDTITGIITESKAGREAIRAARVIDATGDADVALSRRRADVPHAPRGDDGRVGDVPSRRRRQEGVHRRRSRPIRRPTRTGPAAASGTSRPAARRTTCSRRSSSGRSSRRSRTGCCRRR